MVDSAGPLHYEQQAVKLCSLHVIASEAKQSTIQHAEAWIASSLCSSQ